MLEKLFARLRSRQKGDLAAPAGLALTPTMSAKMTAKLTATTATTSAKTTTPAPAKTPAKTAPAKSNPTPATGAASVGVNGAAGIPTLAGPLTPPPLPADAWAEQESGIVITDSGIIILEAEPPQASKPATSPTPARGSSLPPAPPSTPKPRAPGELDWDDVLARARAQAERAKEPAKQPQQPSPNRAKAK